MAKMLGMMLLRDIALGDKKKSCSRSEISSLSPILKCGRAMSGRSEFGRVNQRGTSRNGLANHAKNLNLNRDYTKA